METEPKKLGNGRVAIEFVKAKPLIDVDVTAQAGCVLFNLYITLLIILQTSVVPCPEQSVRVEPALAPQSITAAVHRPEPDLLDLLALNSVPETRLTAN